MDNMSVCNDDNDEEVCIEEQDLPNKNAESTLLLFLMSCVNYII